MKFLNLIKSILLFVWNASIPKFDVSNVAGNALIKLSSIGITNLSGKAGGSVYAHNRGGSYVRNFAVPSNPQTAAQSAARAAFGAWAATWRTLTQESRNAWDEAAKNFPYVDRFGDSKVMSGENLFISLNRNLQLIGVSQITEPPTRSGAAGIVSLNPSLELAAGGAAWASGVVDATLTAGAGSGTRYAVYATVPVSAGISYVKNRYKYLGYLSSADVTQDSGTTLSDLYASVFSLPSEGAKVFIRVVPVSASTGERNASFETSIFVSEAAA